MFKSIFEPDRPLIDLLLQQQDDYDRERRKFEWTVAKEKEKHKFKLASPSRLVKGDIIQDQEGNKYVVLDNAGAIRSIDWERAQKNFRLVASAFPETEAISPEAEELLYDITPEDRQKLREDGII